MPVSVLGHILVSENRLRNTRMPEKLEASVRSGVSSRPVLNEVPVEEDAEPLLVTNARKQFVPTQRSKIRGVARYAFSEVSIDEEPALLAEMYMALLTASWSNRWRNRCSTVTEAIRRLRANALEPSSMVLPESTIQKVCGPEFTTERIDQSMIAQGYVAIVDDVRVLLGDLSSDAAIVLAAPSMSGLYTRFGDYLGVMLQRVDRSIMVVGDGVA